MVFGLFKKKKTDSFVDHAALHEVPVGQGMQPSAASIAKLAEWDAKIAELKEGFHAAIEEAKVASQPLIASGECDLQALDLIWAVVDKRLEKDQKALYRAWSSTDTILSRDELDLALQRALAETQYHEENNELEIAHVGAYREAKARAAQARLALSEDANTKIQVARYIGEWEAFGHWQDMKRAEMRIGLYEKTRDVPMELLHEFHRSAQLF